MNRAGIAVALVCALLAGCASGPKLSEIKSTIPALNPQLGRIYFYRASAVGAAIQPNLELNGEVIGEMVPLGFFYVDRYPGSYELIAKTESTAVLRIVLAANQTRYVRGSLTMGLFVGRPATELVEESVALQEMDDLSYVPSLAISPGGVAPLAAPVSSRIPTPMTQGAPAAGAPANLKDLEGLLPPAGK